MTGRSHVTSSAVWIVEGSILYTPIMVSVMLLRPGPDQDRYRAISPGGLLGALTDGTKWKSSIDKKCWNDVVFASMSLVWTPGMMSWPWRRSDRTFRARDLDLHRTLSGLSDGALGELFRGPGCAAATFGVLTQGLVHLRCA